MRILRAARSFMENDTTSTRAELRAAIKEAEGPAGRVAALLESPWLLVEVRDDGAPVIAPDVLQNLATVFSVRLEPQE